MTSPFEPEKSLYRTQAIGELLEIAATELPELAHDEAQVAVVWKEDSLAVVGTVQVKSLTGQVIASMSKSGEKTLVGKVKWKF